MDALRAFVQSILGDDLEVWAGQDNRLPMPKGSFVILTPLFVTGLSTNVTSYAAESRADLRTTEWRVQLDCYGDNAQDMAVTLACIVRSDIACRFFADQGIDMQPLYAGDPRQTTMINGESQYEGRWTFDFHAQINPVITTPQQSATALEVGLVEVDAKFPPN